MEKHTVRFTDKRGENIVLEESMNGKICAYNMSGRRIGFIDFTVTEFFDSYSPAVCSASVALMHIDCDYRHRGIATEIMRYAQKLYGTVFFLSDEGYGGKSDAVHYTSEGLAFKQYCENQGITEPIVEIDGE